MIFLVRNFTIYPLKYSYNIYNNKLGDVASNIVPSRTPLRGQNHILRYSDTERNRIATEFCIYYYD